MVLLQDKLDVQKKSRSNPFTWRGQFTPDFISYLLSEFASESDVILDPFAGSGTLLYESVLRGNEAHGLEINPAAYAMSKFYTLCSLNSEERDQLISAARLLLLPTLRELGDCTETNVVASRILKLADDKRIRLLLINAAMAGEKGLTLSPIKVLEGFDKLSRFLRTLPQSLKPISVTLADARNSKTQFDNSIDLIITSPPYINVFNYHQNHRVILEAAGWNLLRVADSEFGSNRKNRGNRFRTVVQYALDMEQAMMSFWNSLRIGGRLVLVVGRQSSVRGIQFYNGQIVQDLLTSNDFAVDSRHQRTFVNRFGDAISEDIIVATKLDQKRSACIGRAVAKEHLQRSINKAEGEIQNDILNALTEIDQIQTSPLFNPSNSFLNGEHTS